MASPSSLLFFLLLLPFLSIVSSTITISFSSFHGNPPSVPYQNLYHLVCASQTRAHHLKSPQTGPYTTTAPLFSHSYGAYSIPLGFGTPPQTLPFILDTGSDFTWFPCTRRYVCNNCSLSFLANPPRPFIPKLSSSTKIIGCLNSKCSWLHRSNYRCQDCRPNSRNCTEICPPYLIIYGSGTTGGFALSETLNLPKRTVHNFLVGCSIFSSHQPVGVAGFGRGPASLPSQLGLKKFSYCLLSHRFDDTSKSSSLVLYTDSGSQKTKGLSYTTFTKNPYVPQHPAYLVYYYVTLQQISVGGQIVKIPLRYLTPQRGGSGGTIVDSGTTFTFMARDVFELVASEFERQVKNKYERAVEIEALTGLRPCFKVPRRVEKVSFPELRFHFKGGAEMALPLENYVAAVGDGGGALALCLTVVTDGLAGMTQLAAGPSIILGNFQLQNFYVEYDLKNERFGFRRQSCSSSP